jgi:hypothetical protein
MDWVCAGVAIPWDDLPTWMLALPAVRRRRYRRGSSRPEARFLMRDPDRLIPVLLHGQLRLLPWGAKRGDRSGLPCTGWTWRSTVAAGWWARVRPGQGRLVPRQPGDSGARGQWAQRGPVAYVVVEPASHYYRVMTRSRWMPCLVGQTI